MGNRKFAVGETNNIYFLNLNDHNLYIQNDDLISKILFKNKISIKELIAKTGDYILFTDGCAIFKLNIIDNHLTKIYGDFPEDYYEYYDGDLINITKVILNNNTLYFSEFYGEVLKTVDIDGNAPEELIGGVISDFAITNNNLYVMETPECIYCVYKTKYTGQGVCLDQIWTISDGLAFDMDEDKVYYLTNEAENFGSDCQFSGSKIHCLDLAAKDSYIFF